MVGDYYFWYATTRDVPALVGLMQQLDLPGETSCSAEDVKQLLARFSRYPDYGVYLVAGEEGGTPLGTMSLIVVDELAHGGSKLALVEDVVVSEAARGQGIGKALMQYARKLAEEKGCYKLMLSSHRSRELAHRFYESLGFEQHGFSFAMSSSR